MSQQAKTLSVADLWDHLVENGLLTSADRERLKDRFDQAQGAVLVDATTVATWLLRLRLLTPYQAKMAVRGRAARLNVADYLIEDRIDQGPLAGIYTARHRPTGHPVLLEYHFRPGSEKLASLREQAERAIALVHPGIYRTYDWIEDPHGAAFVLQRIPGVTLSDYLASKGQLRLEMTLLLGHDVVSALAYLHQHDRAYRRLTPASVWITKSGRARLLNDPLVAVGTVEDGVTDSELSFLPPELWTGGDGGQCGDIWAAGALLFNMATGQAPMAKYDRATRLRRGAALVTDWLKGLDAELPESLAELLHKWMAVERDQRTLDANQAVTEIKALLRRADARPADSRPNTAAAYEQWLEQHGGLTNFEENAAHNVASIRAEANSTAANSSEPTGPATSSRPTEVADIGTPNEPEFGEFAAGSVVDHRVARIRRRRRPRLPALLTTVSTILLLAIAFFFGPTLLEQFNSLEPQQPTAGGSTSPPGGASSATVNPTDSGTETGEDSSAREATGSNVAPPGGGEVWPSPTAGPPLEGNWIPPGAQFVAHWRPAQWFQQEAGAATSRAWAPWMEPWQQRIEDLAGLPLTSLERLYIALSPDQSGQWQVSIAALPANAVEIDVLRNSWGNPTGMALGRGEFFEQGQTASWVTSDRLDNAASNEISSASDDEKVSNDDADDESPQSAAAAATQISASWIVAGPLEIVREIAERDGRPTPQRRDIESLLAVSDRERLLTLFFSPAALQVDGATWFPGEQGILLRIADGLFRDDVSAVMLSAHLDDNFFLELFLTSVTDERLSFLATTTQQRIEALRRETTEWLVGHAVSDYSRTILGRYPEMLELLTGYTRTTVTNRMILVRTVLPAVAAHNLALATRLFSLERTSRNLADVDNPLANRPPTTPQTLTAPLERNITLKFSRQTLEVALERFGEEVGLPVKILGKDLQIEGITKNQSLGLDENNQPARAVLGKILALASPDGKLVYTLQVDPETNKQTIFVTTRAAASERGDDLPPQ